MLREMYGAELDSPIERNGPGPMRTRSSPLNADAL